MATAQKFYKRKICATLHRSCGNSTKVVFVRYFGTISRALSRGVELAILEGQPGDVLELSSSNYGYQIATVKLKVNAKDLLGLDIRFYTKDDLESERT